MNNRRNLAAFSSAGDSYWQSQKHWQSNNFGERVIAHPKDVLTRGHRAIMAVGMAAIAALAIMFVRPQLLDDLKTLSPFWDEYSVHNEQRELALATTLYLPEQPAVIDDTADDTPLPLTSSTEQQRVTHWLSKRYRIAGSASQMLVDAAYESAQQVRIDPLLVLAVMAIESRFNPFAESPVGAQGLMQVMAKVHQEKFSDRGGVKAALNPIANIHVGAQILKENIRRSGSVESALKLYVGAGNMETNGGYAGKVMSEYARLQAVASGKRVPTFTPPQQNTEALHEAKAEAPPPPRHQDAEPA